MKKIVDIVIPSLPVGGAEKMVILLAAEFKADGWTVRFILRRTQDSIYHQRVKKEFLLTDLKAPRVRDFPAKLWKFYSSEAPPDLVLVSLWPLTFLTTAVIRAKKMAATRVFTIEHGSLEYRLRNKGRLYREFLARSLRWTIGMSDRVVAVSDGLRKEIAAFSGYDGPKLISIPNPIELSLPPSGSAEENKAIELRKAITDPILLSVGRLKTVKNIPLLLTAFSKVIAQTPAHLLIVGDGDEMEKLRALAESLGVDEQVSFLGYIENCEPFYAMADLFVLSSDSEGFGNVIVEALLKGCTVVATDCDYGPREILRGEEFGYLTPVGDADKLAAAIVHGLANPLPAEVLRERGQQYSPVSVFENYKSAYNSL